MSIDLEALRLELAIAAAARHVYGCMCNREQDDPESVRAVVELGLAIDAAEAYENPPAFECVLEISDNAP